jgi:hypothetical protein
LYTVYHKNSNALVAHDEAVFDMALGVKLVSPKAYRHHALVCVHLRLRWFSIQRDIGVV